MIAQSLVMAIIFLSFVVVTGMGGMVSLAQATFVTAGGFAAGWALSRDWGVDIPGIATHGQINFLWALVIGALAAAALGALSRVPLTRLGGVTLALGTLAGAFVCAFVVVRRSTTIGNGDSSGWTIRPPTLDIPGLNWVNDVLIVNGRPSRRSTSASSRSRSCCSSRCSGSSRSSSTRCSARASGRAMLAVRSSEVAAEASGVPRRTARRS